MESTTQNEQVFEKLLVQFEDGKLSRRGLIKGAALLGMLGLAPEARGHSITMTAPILSSALAEAGNRERGEGRKILLERIMNHTYRYRNDSDNQFYLDGVQISGGIQELRNTSGQLIRITSANHGLKEHERVTVSGVVTVSGPLNINGTWNVVNVMANTFDLQGRNGDNGTVLNVENGKWKLARKEGSIASITNTGGAPIEITTSTPHGLIDGERVEIAGVVDEDREPMFINGVWEITRVDDDTFRLNGSTGTGTAASGGTYRLEHAVFHTAQEHQNWLFGTTATGYEGKGLKQYKKGVNRHAVRDTIRGHNNSEEELVGGSSDRTQRDNCWQVREHLDGKLNAFQLGGAVGIGYDFDDLYGLVRQKLDYVCNHCATDLSDATLSFFQDRRKAAADYKRVTLTNAEYVLEVRDADNNPVAGVASLILRTDDGTKPSFSVELADGVTTLTVRTRDIVHTLFSSADSPRWMELRHWYIDAFGVHGPDLDWEEIIGRFDAERRGMAWGSGYPISEHEDY